MDRITEEGMLEALKRDAGTIDGTPGGSIDGSCSWCGSGGGAGAASAASTMVAVQ